MTHVDIDTARRWLKTCESSHIGPAANEDCTSSTLLRGHENEDGLIRYLRLIDIENRCLRNFHSVSRCPVKYVALSYVWGETSHPSRLDNTTAARLYQSRNSREGGGLPCSTDYIPLGGLQAPSRTIEDAMGIARLLGFNYLWVDVYCIFQDQAHPNANDMYEQINSMQYIYGYAALTIVAARSGDIGFGLRGVRGTRGAIYTHPIREGFAIRNEAGWARVAYDGALARSVWATRAWTLQEHLLSKRCLVFTDEQMIWICQSAQWFESVGFDDARENSPAIAQNTDGDNQVSFKALFLPDGYRAMVETYMTRHLTFAGDVLNAFRGLQTTFRLRNLEGIPIQGFEPNLCFTGPCIEPLLNTRGVDESARSVWGTQVMPRRVARFSTWSWAKWLGPLVYGISGVQLSRAITCFRAAEDLVTLEPVDTSRAHHLTDITDEQRRIAEARERYSPRESKRTCDRSDIPPAMILSRHHLIFWAEVAQLSFRCYQLASLPVVGTNSEHQHSLFEIYSTSTTVGDTLSDCGPALCVFGTSAVSYQDVLSESKVKHDFIAVAYDEKWMFVMRLDYKDGVAFRKDMQRVKTCDWNKLDREVRLIVLA